MKHSRPVLGAGLLAPVTVAALTLAACNRSDAGGSNGAAPNRNFPNGDYVAGSNNTALPVSAPPPGTYEAVSEIPPPPIPVYDQPPMPEPGDIWTPGYWAWSDADNDYYWAPGTWVTPPEPGLYWTPGYWRYWDGEYLYSPGYWGPAVGFYGGIDYGWGYYGLGYAGGRWEDGRFWYNRRANNFGRWRVERAYDQPVRTIWNRASYNGGPGGLTVGPTPLEAQASRARHAPPSREQVEQTRLAGADPQFHARVNRGAPPIAGVSRPGVFHGRDAVVTGARSPAAWTSPSRPQGREQPGFAARPAPGAAPTPGGPAAPRFEVAPAAPAARPPAPAPERPGRVFTPAPAPAPERPGRAFTPAPAPPEFRAAPAARLPAPAPERPGRAFTPAPAQPEFRAAPAAPSPQFHPAPAYHPAPAFHAAPAPSFHAPPAPAPSFHVAPAPAVRPAPAPTPHPATPAQPKRP